MPIAAAAALAFGALPAGAATFNWTNGTFGAATSFSGPVAPSTLPAADTLVLSSTASKGFTTDFTNDGTVQHQLNGGALFIGGGATITNNGLWEEQGANVIGVSTGGSFVNNGIYRKLNVGLSTFGPTSLVNNGTIDLQQGTLTLGGGFASNAGLLMGNGLINFFGALTNAGTLAPGSAGVGTLTLNGNFLQQATGTFAVDLNSMASKDFFNISGGNASLDGTLALNCLGACSFAVGDSFTILSSLNPRIGMFSTVSLNGFATGAFDVVYGSNSVSLVVTEAVTAVPEPGTWAMLMAGLAALTALGRARKKSLGHRD